MDNPTHHRQHLSTMVTTSASEISGHPCCGGGGGGDNDTEESSTPASTDNQRQPSDTSSSEPLPSPASQKRPVRQSLWEAVRRNPHFRCLALSLLIVACLSLTFWCQLEKINSLLIALRIMDSKLFNLEVSATEEGGEGKNGTCDDGLLFLPLVALVSLYLGYLVECWHSTTRLVLMYRVPCDAVYSVVEQMRQAQPIIWWKAACFHHVRHARPISRYRSGSSTSAGGPVFQERVTTHVSGSYFSYSSCGVKDISKTLAGLERFPTTRVYLSKGFAFANERSAAEFDEQRSTFFRANERYDHYLEIREGLDLVGVNWQEVMITAGGKGSGGDGGNSSVNPWYNNQLTYWLFSVILLSWPLRVLLEYNTAYVHYQIVKLFGVNYNGGGETSVSCGQQQLQQSLNPLSRVSTMDTLSNCLIAPSYSEAMLSEQQQQQQQQQFYFPGQSELLRPEGGTSRRDDGDAEEEIADQKGTTSTNLVATSNSGILPFDGQSSSRYERPHLTMNHQNELIHHHHHHNHQSSVQSLSGEDHLQTTEEPPSYDEVFAYQQQHHFVQPRDIEVIIANSPQDFFSSSSSFHFSPRPSLKSYWHHLLGLILGGQQNSRKNPAYLPRSITDKDFFQKLLASQLLPYSSNQRGKPTSSSYGDISHNLVAHV